MYSIFRLYRTKSIASSLAGNLSASRNSQLVFSREFFPTTIRLKARNEQEAMKKANKFWQEGDFGGGSIAVRKE